jgi:hypothetical protein
MIVSNYMINSNMPNLHYKFTGEESPERIHQKIKFRVSDKPQQHNLIHKKNYFLNGHSITDLNFEEENRTTDHQDVFGRQLRACHQQRSIAPGLDADHRS